MASYDPKRPRPGAGETEDPAPVEALLSPAPESPESPSAAEVEVDLRVVASNGSSSRSAREVPVAPAPEQGTANRARRPVAASAALGLRTPLPGR